MTELQRTSRSPLRLGWEFFKIGCVAFGGFMAVISVVEDVFVRRLRWLKQEDMLDGVSLANVLPGPQAVNTVAYVGYGCGGRAGALMSVIGILTPTYVLVTILTFLYFGFARDVQALDSVFAGLVLAVVAVIFNVVRRMRARCLLEPLTWTLALASAALVLVAPPAVRLWVNLGVLGAAAIAGMVYLRPDTSVGSVAQPPPLSRIVPLVVLPLGLAALYLVGLPLPQDSMAHVGVTFAGLSMLLFGGGYVFIPMIMDVVVTQEGWLTLTEFNDGIALSQVTPGPIVISAAFIGQKVAMEQHGALWGVLGGLVATVAIFGPPALLMVAASQMLERIKGSARTQGALRGARAAVVGMIAAAGLLMLQAALVQGGNSATEIVTASTIMVLAMVALARFELPVVLVIPAAGVLGGLLL